jgi:hypothetical protein
MSPGLLLVVAVPVGLQADTANMTNSNSKTFSGARFIIYTLFSYRFGGTDLIMARPFNTSELNGRCGQLQPLLRQDIHKRPGQDRPAGGVYMTAVIPHQLPCDAVSELPGTMIKSPLNPDNPV